MISFLVSCSVAVLRPKKLNPPRGGLHSPHVCAVCASQTMTTLCRNTRPSILDLGEGNSSQSSFSQQQKGKTDDEEWVTYPSCEGLIYTLVQGAPPSEVRCSISQ